MTTLIIILVFSIVGTMLGLAGGEVLRRLLHYIVERRPLRRLLDFDNRADIAIVYPPRDPGLPPRILPDIAVEDFMAIWNVLRMLDAMGWQRHRIHICDHDYYYQRKQEYERINRIIICSPKSNNVAKEALEQSPDVEVKFKCVKPAPNEEWVITAPNAKFCSDSYGQEHTAPKGPISDIALLAKFANPMNSGTGLTAKILMLAGIRGIGTWGVADFLRKYHGTRVRHDCAGRSFAMIVQITYENFDINSNQSRPTPYCNIW